MKKLIPFFLILISCGNDDVVTIPKEEYKKLKGDTIKPDYTKPFELFNDGNHISHIVLGSDEHEYIEIVLKHSRDPRDTYNVLHSPECVKCKKVDTIIHTNSVTNQ